MKTKLFISAISALYLLCFAQKKTFQDIDFVNNIDRYINQKIIEKEFAGAVILVNKNGVNIFNKAYGYQDIDDKIPMNSNSIFRIYSMSKPITSLAAMILVDKNLIGLDDPIEKYLPELKSIKVMSFLKVEHLKRSITIKDLLTHTSGFAYGLGIGTSALDMKYNTNHPLFASNGDEMIKKLASFPIQSQPGEEFHYSLSIDILGVIIERVSGMILSKFIDEEILTPLGMTDTYFKLPQSKVKLFCSIYGIGLKLKESYKDSEYIKDRLESGGGGLVSSSKDYLKFCQLILNKGIWNSDTILSPNLVEKMINNQLPEGEGVYKQKNEVGIGFGLGFSVNLKEWGKYGHKGDIGWSGIGGTHFVISPKENLVAIIMTQKQPFSDKIKRELMPMIYEGLEN